MRIVQRQSEEMFCVKRNVANYGSETEWSLDRQLDRFGKINMRFSDFRTRIIH
jgi:hypothetical protein